MMPARGTHHKYPFLSLTMLPCPSLNCTSKSISVRLYNKLKQYKSRYLPRHSESYCHGITDSGISLSNSYKNWLSRKGY